MAKIIETDNFGGDYPDEKFVFSFPLKHETCIQICRLINNDLSEKENEQQSRFYNTVENDYVLRPGFEP